VLHVLLVIVHVMVSLTLILVVLLQVGKGQSIGAAFGGAGSSQTFFGSRGPATFLSRLTTVSAAVFMVTSLSLAYLSSSGERDSSIRERALPPVTDTVPAPVPTPEPAAPSAPSNAPVPDTAPAPAPESPAQPVEPPKQAQ
jgi:preprotein translocase subunit SecG